MTRLTGWAVSVLDAITSGWILGAYIARSTSAKGRIYARWREDTAMGTAQRPPFRERLRAAWHYARWAAQMRRMR